MKVNKLKEELKSLSYSELKKKLDLLRREYFGLRLNAMTAHIKDYSQFKKLRRSIACISTYIHQKQQEKAKG